MPYEKETYLVTLKRPVNITVDGMERHIRDAVKKLDTRHKDWTPEVMVISDVHVEHQPLADAVSERYIDEPAPRKTEQTTRND